MKKGQIYLTLAEACEICGLPTNERSRKKFRDLGCEVRFSPRGLRYDVRKISKIGERRETA